MGFRFDHTKTTFPAEVKDGQVIVHITDDFSMSFKTTIKDNIPTQCNGFVGKGVLFCFKHDHLIYVGRHNGTWTAYRDSDYFLKKQGTWSYGKPLILVGGYIEQMTTQDVYAFKGNNKLLVLSGTSGYYTANEAIDFAPELVDESVGNLLIEKQLLIYTKGGCYDFAESVQWTAVPIPTTRFSLG